MPKRGTAALRDAEHAEYACRYPACSCGSRGTSKTTRPAPRPAARRDSLAQTSAGDRVIGPRPFGIGRLQTELFGPCPLLAVLQRLFEQLVLVEGFDRPPFVRRSGQPQRGLLFQHQGNRRAMCSQTVSQAVQSKCSRFLASVIAVMVTTTPFRVPAAPPVSGEAGSRGNTRRGRCQCRHSCPLCESTAALGP